MSACASAHHSAHIHTHTHNNELSVANKQRIHKAHTHTDTDVMSSGVCVNVFGVEAVSRLTTICSTNHQFVVQPLRVWFGRSSSAAARSILVHRVCVCLLCFVHLFFHLWLSTALVSKRCYKSQITAQANRNPKLLLNREYAECVTYSVDNVLLLVITTYRLKISKSQC